MAVFRIHKNKNYTAMSNYHLRDKNLSYKAKGLLSMMLSLPDDWDYSIKGLEKISKEKEVAIKDTLNELKRYNYLIVNKDRNEKGLFNYEYNIYEKPGVCYPGVDNPEVDNPDLDNQVQINTNILNTKKQNTKLKENIKRKYFKDKELNDLFNEFLDLRVKLKAKNTDRAITLLLNELNKWDKETQMEMINNSIMGSWKSVYPLKNTKRIEPLPEWFGKEIVNEKDEEVEEIERRFFESIENEENES
jgi:hypothetical protein